MRQVVVSTIAWAVLGAVAAVVALLIGVDRTDLVLDAYLVFAGALVAIAAARAARRVFPAPRGTVPAVVASAQRRYPYPESLAAIEDDVALAQADQFDVHFRLRPLFRDIAAAGLATQSGVDLEREQERARQQLSPAMWELVRPDRPRPERQGVRGIDNAALSEAVAELERILPA
jgi:hypothetical protein